MKPSNDREAITFIIQGLVDQGHTLTSVIDDTWNQDEKTYTSDVDEAVDLICGVDEGFVLFGDESSWVYFVLGNEPEEVANNHTVNLDVSAITDPWWK